MEDYQKGNIDGKKSVGIGFILYGFLSFLGLIFVYKDKPVRSLFKEHSDQYFDGYYNGVIKRRWMFFLGGLLFIMLHIAVISIGLE